MNLLNNILILVLIIILINYLTNGKLFFHVKQSYDNIKMKCFNWIETDITNPKDTNPKDSNPINSNPKINSKINSNPINPDADIFLISDNIIKEKMTNDLEKPDDNDSLIPSSIEFSTV